MMSRDPVTMMMMIIGRRRNYDHVRAQIMRFTDRADSILNYSFT